MWSCKMHMAQKPTIINNERIYLHLLMMGQILKLNSGYSVNAKSLIPFSREFSL